MTITNIMKYFHFPCHYYESHAFLNLTISFLWIFILPKN